MKLVVNYTPEFGKEVRQLKKKYPLLHEDIRKLLTELEDKGYRGDLISGVGRAVYKARLTNKSAKRGKSGGFRALYTIEANNVIILFHIYSKTDKADIGLAEIRQKLKDLS